MKHILSILTILLGACGVNAQTVADGNADVKSVTVSQKSGQWFLNLDLDLSAHKLSRDKQVSIVPVIYNSDSTIIAEMQPIVLAGHNLYYKHLRDKDLDPEAILVKSGDKASLMYVGSTDDFAPATDDYMVNLDYRVGGCCDELIAQGSDLIFTHETEPVFVPEYNYITNIKVDSVKLRHLDGRAYVDFPVNKTVIYPDYRLNRIELGKILATIDSVRNDEDLTVNSLSIKGFASPEGSYANNERLAKGRTEALKEYVNKLYRFEPGFIKTSYEPEDWEGLRKYVESSQLAHRQQILDIIDSDIAPDPKNTKIQRTYPEEYAFLLKEVYPGLRHSDYRVDYTIRSFTSVDEILSVMAYAPQKLSLNEFFRAGATMQPGTPEYNNVFETAVRMYPDSPVANLNAANAAMTRGDLDSAERYLAKADSNDPTTIYALGILAARQGDWDKAESCFSRAARLRVADAPAALEQVQKIKAYKAKYK